jgi:hypothetical protein
LGYEWHQSQVSSTLDSGAELALLLGAEAGFASWFNLSVDVDEALHSFYIFVVKVCWNVAFESASHD